jgi:hypothetical protein
LHPPRLKWAGAAIFPKDQTVEVSKSHRVITQTLLIELDEKDPHYEKHKLWLLVDKLIEHAIEDGECAIKYLSYC